MPIPVLVNRDGGTARARASTIAAELRAAFADAGLAIDLAMIDGHGMAAAVAGVADRPIVAVGGGDGTIGTAAGAIVAVGGAATLAVLPLGTRNHLARELGLPMALPELARLIAAGTTRTIDLAEVDGRAFVNNASIGFYPAMVRRRDAVRRLGHLPKWLANLPAAWGVLKRGRHHRLRLCMAGREQAVRTPLLFVGNNRYALEPGKLGARESLEDGLLSVFAVERATASGLVRFALRTVAGRADPERDFAALGETAALEVRAHAAAIDVALDGEVVRLATPLHFRVLPHALTVIAPPPAQAPAGA